MLNKKIGKWFYITGFFQSMIRFICFFPFASIAIIMSVFFGNIEKYFCISALIKIIIIIIFVALRLMFLGKDQLTSTVKKLIILDFAAMTLMLFIVTNGVSKIIAFIILGLFVIISIGEQILIYKTIKTLDDDAVFNKILQDIIEEEKNNKDKNNKE